VSVAVFLFVSDEKEWIEVFPIFSSLSHIIIICFGECAADISKIQHWKFFCRFINIPFLFAIHPSLRDESFSLEFVCGKPQKKFPKNNNKIFYSWIYNIENSFFLVV
jgi:hypothetical protein